MLLTRLDDDDDDDDDASFLPISPILCADSIAMRSKICQNLIYHYIR